MFGLREKRVALRNVKYDLAILFLPKTCRNGVLLEESSLLMYELLRAKLNYQNTLSVQGMGIRHLLLPERRGGVWIIEGIFVFLK